MQYGQVVVLERIIQTQQEQRQTAVQRVVQEHIAVLDRAVVLMYLRDITTLDVEPMQLVAYVTRPITVVAV